MIISHSRKFCYWKIARTGSNTAELCIRLVDVLDLSQDLVTSCHFFPAAHNVREQESGHTTPTEAIRLGYLTSEQYAEYDHYTIVRDPIKRWVSAYGYRMRMQMSQTLTPQDFFENRKIDLVQRRQSDYLGSRIQTFPFSDYENSIRNIVNKMGGTLDDVPRLEHKTRQLWRVMAEREVRGPLGQQVRDYYVEDFNLSY